MAGGERVLLITGCSSGIGLEAARTTREATRDRLTAASLARLTAPRCR